MILVQSICPWITINNIYIHLHVLCLISGIELVKVTLYIVTKTLQISMVILPVNVAVLKQMPLPKLKAESKITYLSGLSKYFNGN